MDEQIPDSLPDFSSDEFFMREALREAARAAEEGEIPVGAVVVAGNQVIARAHNLTETLHDVTAHAEMQAITAASEFLGGKYLKDCTLFVSLEPCGMCAGALGWAQLARLVYGASDPEKGFSGISTRLLHPKTIITAGVMEKECSRMLLDFFASRRK